MRNTEILLFWRQNPTKQPILQPEPEFAGLVSGADLTFATLMAGISREANVKSKAPLKSIFCQWSFDSNIRESASCDGARMLESDHWPRFCPICC